MLNGGLQLWIRLHVRTPVIPQLIHTSVGPWPQECRGF